MECAHPQAGQNIQQRWLKRCLLARRDQIKKTFFSDLKKFLKFLGVAAPAIGMLGTFLLMVIPDSNEDLDLVKERLNDIEYKIDSLSNQVKDFIDGDEYRRAVDLLFPAISKVKTGMR